MAFGDLATQIILFIAVIGLATGVVAGMKVHVDKTASSMALQQSRISDKIETDITIEIVSYETGTPNQVVAYIKNTGNKVLDINKTDAYLDDLRVPRLAVNRSIEVIADTDTTNTGYWDPGEEALIKIRTS